MVVGTIKSSDLKSLGSTLSPDYDDSCDHNSHFEHKCGDKCSQLCWCGRSWIEEFDEFCCSDKPCLDLDQNYEFYYANRTNCTEGRALKTSQLCNGKCNNNYLTSKSISLRATFSCLETRECIPWQYWCQGVSFCLDDVNICSQDLKCPRERNGFIQIGSVTINATGIGHGHTYCKIDHPTIKFSSIPDIFTVHNENYYNNIDRSDESYKMFSNNRGKKFDFELLTNCNTSFGPGLKCGGGCLENYLWCNDIGRENCGNFYSDDSELCSKHTFWKSVPCSKQLYDKFHSEGLRCRGKIQHCYHPLYTWSIPKISYDFIKFFKNKPMKKSCMDKSDRIIPTGRKCSDIAKSYIAEFKSRNPNHGCWHNYMGLLKCDKPYDYDRFEKEYGTTVSNPHNCKDSCDKPSPDCISCTNPKYYFTCEINGTRQCIHTDLVCDGHPQCVGGEDEENCLEEYRKDAEKDATHICDNIYYPGRI